MGIQAFFHRNARKDERIIELSQQIAHLTMQSTQLAEEKALLVAEKERLELTWKTTYDDLQARHDRLAATIGELEQAYGELGLRKGDTTTFLQRVITGSSIRADHPGGRALIEQAKALLRQYKEE